MEHDLIEYMEGYLAHLKSVEMWLHSAHHVSKGKGFLSDHNNLYGTMYTQIGDHFDILVEKSIALSGDENIACPINLGTGISAILNNHYSSPVNKDSEEIVKLAIQCVSNLINSLTSLYEVFKFSGFLTLGMEDTLSSMANEYEKYLYFLGQRYKS